MCACARARVCVFMNERDQRCILITHVHVPISRVRVPFSPPITRYLRADGTFYLSRVYNERTR